MPTFEILCATMHQNDFSKINEMNIKSNVVFANQCDHTSYEEMEFDGHTAKMISTETRGVGKNRNLALMYATADICLFADDDLVYADGYEKIIQQAFQKLPQADGIIFNVESLGYDYGRRRNAKIKRVRWYNAFNYGVVRLAVKRNSIMRENIMFSTNFGGGAPFSCGEDTLFISGMLKRRLKLFVFPEVIVTVKESESTWFHGYNSKFYYDKGVLYASISSFFAKFLCLQNLIRHPDYKKNGLTFYEAYGWMKKGIKNRLEMKSFDK